MRMFVKSMLSLRKSCHGPLRIKFSTVSEFVFLSMGGQGVQSYHNLNSRSAMNGIRDCQCGNSHLFGRILFSAHDDW